MTDIVAMRDQALADADVIIRRIEREEGRELTDYMRGIVRQSYAAGFFAGRTSALDEQIAQLRGELADG